MTKKAKFYRGIHPQVKNEVKKIARAHYVPADDVALAFFHASIQALRDGALELEPQPIAGRMTLFPENEEPGWRYTQMPLLPERTTKVFYATPRPRKRWKFSATYRVPEEIHAEISQIADEYLIGIGIVAGFFLQWGLQEYHEERLELIPRALTIKQSLFFSGASW